MAVWMDIENNKNKTFDKLINEFHCSIQWKNIRYLLEKFKYDFDQYSTVIGLLINRNTLINAMHFSHVTDPHSFVDAKCVTFADSHHYSKYFVALLFMDVTSSSIQIFNLRETKKK